MTNGAGMAPAPYVSYHCGSFVRVALVAQVHGLLQRAAGSLHFFVHAITSSPQKGSRSTVLKCLAAVRSCRSASQRRPRGLHGEEATWTSSPRQEMMINRRVIPARIRGRPSMWKHLSHIETEHTLTTPRREGQGFSGPRLRFPVSLESAGGLPPGRLTSPAQPSPLRATARPAARMFSRR
jgi:hypothetical protein